MARVQQRIPRSTDGFTLGEVMIAMFLISMLCLGIFAALQQISGTMMAIAIRDEAYHLMQAKAEQLLSGNYADFTASADESITSAVKTSFHRSTAAALMLPSDNGGGRITFTRRVTQVASTTSTRTLEVEVDWAWHGRTASVSTPLFRTNT